jgi:hypothetical protein
MVSVHLWDLLEDNRLFEFLDTLKIAEIDMCLYRSAFAD